MLLMTIFIIAVAVFYFSATYDRFQIIDAARYNAHQLFAWEDTESPISSRNSTLSRKVYLRELYNVAYRSAIEDKVYVLQRAESKILSKDLEAVQAIKSGWEAGFAARSKVLMTNIV